MKSSLIRYDVIPKTRREGALTLQKLQWHGIEKWSWPWEGYAGHAISRILVDSKKLTNGWIYVTPQWWTKLMMMNLTALAVVFLCAERVCKLQWHFWWDKVRGTVQACMQQVGRAGHCWKCKIFLSEGGIDGYSPITLLLLQKFHVFSSEEYKMFYPIQMSLG